MQKRNWVRWLVLSAVALLGLAVIYVIFNFLFLDFFVDLWWFRSLNYERYYLMRLFYRYVVFSVVLLVFFLIFFLNFWVASRFLGRSSAASRKLGDPERVRRSERLLTMFQSGSLRVYLPLSLLMAIPIAIPFYEKWEQGLLYIFGPGSGFKDPTFGRDISYYLFSLPVYTFIQNRLIITFTVLFLALLLLYFIEKRLLYREEKTMPGGARGHLTFVAVIIIALQTWGFALNRVQLLYTDSHEPLFFGPGFIEMWLDLPLIWLTMISFAGTALFTLIYLYKGKGAKILLGFALAFLAVFSLRNTVFVPEAIQQYIVKPNEAIREQPYISNSIQATLDAFGLNDVKTREYPIANTTDFLKAPDVQGSLHNVPVWDRELLDDVYSQLQSFRTYYTFNNVDVDRYTVGGALQQVYLSAREMTLDDLPDAAKNWVNMHLQYTHGHGVVMTPAAQGGEEPMTWFMRDIPVESDYGFALKQPEIYYGEEEYRYVIVPNDLGEIDQVKGETRLVNYSGKGGIPLSSVLRKLLFAVYFKDRNIFFTTKTNHKSRILFRRNFRQATEMITPFFVMDDDPYMVSTGDGLFWIQDAYTVSDMYPNAQRYTKNVGNKMFDRRSFNYIRNSVKIVVDAYNGEIQYYIADPTDPIIRAYRRIYPGLLREMDKMPAELRKHLRYPRELFRVQMDIYAKYHQTDPDTFYREEDTWEFARMGTMFIRPYHLTLNLLDARKQEFILVVPMSPRGRDNLRSLAIVGCDGDNYGKMVVYSFPKGQQVYGPSQINALINQDTEIAQELTLWDQAGSEVKFGRMIVLPVGKSVLYIQPVYLRSASRLKIPELKRIMVSQGDIVIMDQSLEGALQKLEQKLTERAERIRKRMMRPALRSDRNLPERRTGHRLPGNPPKHNPFTKMPGGMRDRDSLNCCTQGRCNKFLQHEV